MEYQKTGKYFVQVAGGLESHAAQELTELGATVLQTLPRGLRISCQKQELYRILYCSRLSQRILAPIFSFRCHSEKYLYDQVFKAMDWTTLFALDQSFGIECNVSSSNISNSLYSSQLCKDAICDRFRQRFDQRPDFATQNADLTFNLHIRENWACLAIDLSGVSMHKRGYRLRSNLAPLQETLAAAIIRLSGWKSEKPLLDPMCGSGTILAEALMQACKIPAGFLRQDKGIRYLPDFDEDLYRRIKAEEDARIIPLPQGLISGSDCDPQAIETARENLSRLPGGGRVVLSTTRFQDRQKILGMCIISNPPYGQRLESSSKIDLLYNELGDFLKQKCPASEAYILCGNTTLVSALRLRAHWKKSLKNGDLEVKLAKIIIR